jgi:RHS repeat-associated protein
MFPVRRAANCSTCGGGDEVESVASGEDADVEEAVRRDTYDANGNVTNRNGSTALWTSYDRPFRLYGPDAWTQLHYGPDRQLWQQVTTTAGVAETTTYVGELLEKVSKSGLTTWKHYVEAPTGTAAVYLRRSDGTADTYYLTHDHLGSTDKVLNAAGGVVTVEESFTALGARRGSDWQGMPTPAQMAAIAATTRDGFTGHDMLDSVGLIHMRGRVYDPVIGRFLSVDPLVRDATATQSWNGYGYVEGRALSATDPTGFEYEGLWELVVEDTRLRKCDNFFGITCNVSIGQDFLLYLRNQGWLNSGPGTTGSIPGAGAGESVAPQGEATRIGMCFAAGAATGAVGAVVVGAVAVGAAALGAPVATVTAGLGVLAVAGGAILGIDVAANFRNRNWPGLAYDAGSVLGSAAIGGAGGRTLAESVNGVPSRPWSWSSDLAQQYDPRLGSLREWLGTGPNPGSAGATSAAGGAGGAALADGCQP